MKKLNKGLTYIAARQPLDTVSIIVIVFIVISTAGTFFSDW